MRCHEVRKLILTVPEDAPESETRRRVSEHLSGCSACRRLYACSQGLEAVFLSEKLRLRGLASRTQAGKNRVFAEIARYGCAKPARRFRVAWAGAALLLAMATVSVIALFRDRQQKEPAIVRTAVPRVTQPVAAAASSQTVHALAEVVGRHKAPTLELPYSAPTFWSDSFVPQLFRQSTLQSAETLTTVIEARTNLTRRNET